MHKTQTETTILHYMYIALYLFTYDQFSNDDFEILKQ